MEYVYKEGKQIDKESLKSLYEDVEWFAYTKDLDQLAEAVAHSLYVLSIWDNDELIGLIRVVGDGLTIIYIQDILVLKCRQNQGIASELIRRVLIKYRNVRQKVLLTEEAAGVRHFYEKNGFESCDQGTLVAFAKLG
ncbi:GNAT family N-acetyltransferase [Planomicrobium sp. MB-3u-38]|uniref:GNAT family N-acetyltransferase n=1 Tax=Planomicrobium sp. MB-3u-38 TaxID=2058318 RepID=UPI000C7D5C14|nr:GNAT family N-acetyltransferase [Planomicrobium sp. MB-3u-38]PKH12153.1 GNAT family N-acetyltransferase [Planomicrobium sp. MB-3u-38]